jgi:hypothetical protein
MNISERSTLGEIEGVQKLEDVGMPSQQLLSHYLRGPSTKTLGLAQRECGR